MKSISLYNNDGSLSAQAQSLLSPKPDDMSMKEWRKMLKEFRSQLSNEESAMFVSLRKKTLYDNYGKTYQKAYHHKNKEERNVWQRAYHQKTKEKRNACSRAYHQKTKEKRNACSRAYHHKNKEERRAYDRAYRQKNKEERRAYDRAYRQKNKEERRAYMAEYNKNRRQKDPLYNFFHSIRSQAVRVVKQVGLGKKPTNTFEWVGCSPDQLKDHIESLFKEGMTWDNYGRYGWHVDHIRPVASFKPEEWEQINHYTNLQPLWWQDNLSKSNKIQ